MFKFIYLLFTIIGSCLPSFAQQDSLVVSQACVGFESSWFERYDTWFDYAYNYDAKVLTTLSRSKDFIDENRDCLSKKYTLEFDRVWFLISIYSDIKSPDEVESGQIGAYLWYEIALSKAKAGAVPDLEYLKNKFGHLNAKNNTKHILDLREHFISIRDEAFEVYKDKQKWLQEGCSDIPTLYDEKIMGPVRNQGTAGWCYAYTIADLASFALKKPVSAADIALSYNFSNDYLDATQNPALQTGGFILSGLEDMNNSFCLEENLTSNYIEFNSKQNTHSVIHPYSILNQFYNPEGIKEDTLPQDDLNKALGIFLNIVDAWNKLSESTLQELVADSCDPRVIIENHVGIRSDFRGDATGVGGPVDDLERFKVEPIEMLNRLLENGYVAGLGIEKQVFSAESNHAVVAVARRMNIESNQCEYYLKNSWGAEVVHTSRYLDHKDGFTWVSKETLDEFLINTVGYVPEDLAAELLKE